MDKVIGQHQHDTRSAAEDDPAMQCDVTCDLLIPYIYDFN